MTEAEWISSTDPAALLRWLTYTTGGGMGDGPPLWFRSDRKLRLLEDACFSRFGLSLNAAAAQAVPLPGVCDLIRCVHGNPWRPVARRDGGFVHWLVGDDSVTYAPPWLTPTVLAVARTIYQERRPADLPILADALEEAGCDDAGLLAHLRQVGGPCPQCKGGSKRAQTKRVKEQPPGVFVSFRPEYEWVDSCCAVCHGAGRVPAPHALPGCWVLELLLGKD